MKKLMILFLSAVMAFLCVGTAVAATNVELNFTGGVSNIYWGPSFGTAPGGASVYVVGGTVTEIGTITTDVKGVTLYAVSNTLTNTAGTELRAVALKAFDPLLGQSGATPIGGPQLISGTSDTVVLYVQAAANHKVGNSKVYSGNTLYCINGGTGALYWSKGIESGLTVPSGHQTTGSLQNSSVFTGADAGLTPYCLAPVTIDNESVNTSGATIYGVSGATTQALVTGGAGVSVWAISAQTGTYATNGITVFPAGGTSGGVSNVQAAPVISGTSLFIIGYSQAYGGLTIYQFLKNNLKAGVSAVASVGRNVDLSDQWIPTPCISGDSLFVVDNNGGVTSYNKANLNRNWTTPSIRYVGNEAVSGVTAGPVTNGTFIVLCSTSSVSAYTLNKLSTGVAQWGHNFGANKTIDATPAISNGYVWVTVNDQTAASSTTYRFKLNSTTGDILTVANHGKLTYASPIIVGNNLWSVSYNPVVEKIQAAGAEGQNYWPQFKFDAAKAGENTAAAEEVVVADDDDGTCFISTLK